MSGNFMQDWFTLLLAFTVGLAPFTTFWSIVRLAIGKEPPAQNGCTVSIVAFAILLLIVAPFLGYWCFQNFAVVWRA